MKGIAPIIATVLMLLIVLALIGFAYTFLSGLFGTTAEQTDEQLKATISQMAKGVWIDRVYDDGTDTFVTVRNLGSEDINLTSELTVRMGGAEKTCDWPDDMLLSGTTEVCNISGETCPTGTVVEAAGPSNTATKTC